MTNELLAEVSLLRYKVKKYEEAWKKIKEEIDKLKETSTWYNIATVIKIDEMIDKHLQEVEEK